MWSTIKTTVVTAHRSFHKSGVIWFARIQVLLGAAWFALTSVDLAPLIGNPKYVTAWLVFSGLITEYTRRAHTFEDQDGHLLPSRSPVIDVTVNTGVPAAPASPLGPTDSATK